MVTRTLLIYRCRECGAEETYERPETEAELVELAGRNPYALPIARHHRAWGSGGHLALSVLVRVEVVGSAA
ncbi:MAG TPA: hypothetical protein VHE30_25980 [Polyangiaceae bacterium]|nr:hypothetical protein [Polyangiaceae bacterium]